MPDRILLGDGRRRNDWPSSSTGRTMTLSIDNLFANVPHDPTSEQVTELMSAPNVKIERIVSHGQASPPGLWYDQEWAEWVVVLAGSAGLLIEGEAAPRHLKAGNFVHIGAHVRHRVEWTDTPTFWLAVHYR
jgi:cupin 2 domain-containing protein